VQKQEVPKTWFGDLIIIIRRNGAKTISYQTSFGNLIIIIRRRRRNGAKTLSLQTSFGDLIIRNGANTICLPNFVWGT
jgi:hypothetical protein